MFCLMYLARYGRQKKGFDFDDFLGSTEINLNRRVTGHPYREHLGQAAGKHEETQKNLWENCQGNKLPWKNWQEKMSRGKNCREITGIDLKASLGVGRYLS